MSEWKENVDLRTIDDVIENLQGNIDEITLVNNVKKVLLSNQNSPI